MIDIPKTIQQNKNAFQKDAYRPLFTIQGVSLTETPLDRDPPPAQRPPPQTQTPLATSFVGGKKLPPVPIELLPFLSDDLFPELTWQVLVEGYLTYFC